MKNSSEKRTESYDGFAEPLQPSTDLGLAMLIAENGAGNYEPVGTVSTINEAKEIAAGDTNARIRCAERGADILCPVQCKVRARGGFGWFGTVFEIDNLR